MIACRRGLAWTTDGGDDLWVVPKSFFDAMLSARVRALPRDGDADNSGAFGFGGGGKAVLAEGPATGDPPSELCRKTWECRFSVVGEPVEGRLRAAVISK